MMDHNFCAIFLLLWTCVCESALFVNEYAVYIKGSLETANSVAAQHGFTNLGEVFDNHFHFIDSRPRERRSPQRSNDHHVRRLSEDPQVQWIEQQKLLVRKKRDSETEPTFNDPKWPKLWYLHREGIHMNVLQAWARNYTGKGVVVTILDDGIERIHPDLSSNYDPVASYDVNGQDSDPSPRYSKSNENRHGTRCAGEVAAIANNGICSVGVAYRASIGGVRMLDGDVTDLVESKSLSHRPQHVDIYSSSWGPDDDGKTVDGPGPLAKKAFEEGIKKGRNGLGSIFVWASGNGGRSHDSCSCDGYTNTVYTLSISSVSETGKVPWYSEKCASTLATTYSSGSGNEKNVITTDLNKKCTEGHSGTSASAPLAAAICALALEANPNLTWRDLQHIIVMTSRSEGLEVNDWTINGAGYRVSHAYGFGLMNAGAMVAMAEQWNIVPEQHVCTEKALSSPRQIPSTGSLIIKYNTSACTNSDYAVFFLEHVQAKISINFNHRGDLVIYLTSPMGTKSNLLTKRIRDSSAKGFSDWEFMTTHSWGEDPRGVWTLEVKNVGSDQNAGALISWSLILYGTTSHPLEDHIGPKVCPGGYHLSPKSTENGTLLNVCTPCHYSCRSCFGVHSTDCIECKVNYKKRDTYCFYVFLTKDNLWYEVATLLAFLLILFLLFFLCCFHSKMSTFLCGAKTFVNAEMKIETINLLDDDDFEAELDIADNIYRDNVPESGQDKNITNFMCYDSESGEEDNDVVHKDSSNDAANVT